MHILDVIREKQQYTAQQLMDMFVYNTTKQASTLVTERTNKQIRDDKNSIEYDEQKAVDYEYKDSRRPRLQLKNLRQMRHKSDARKAEIADHQKFVHFMYGNKDDELSDELRIDLMKNKLDNEIALQKTLIQNRAEIEKEKLKQKTELYKAKLKIQADAQEEHLNRQANAQEFAVKQQTVLRRDRAKAQADIAKHYTKN